MATLWQDVRFAVRLLMKSPGFTLTVVLILTLGIGATTTIFSVVNGVLVQPLPFREPHRLAQILTLFDESESHRSRRGKPVPLLCLLDLSEIRKRNHVFQYVAALESNDFVDVSGEEPRKVLGVRVSPDFFSCLGIRPLLGRGFRPEEGQPGEDQVVVLGYQYWRQRYGADPSVIGKTIVFKEGAYTIVGVLPARFRFLEYRGICDLFARRAEESGAKEFSVWKPLAPTPEQLGERSLNRYNALVFARLRPGATLAQAQAELDVIGRQLVQEHPRSSKRSFPIVSVPEQATAGVRPALWALLGAVAFVLLIACANVASMLLGRSLGRCREVAIRVALGASRVRLIRQFLTESLLLSFSGGICAMLLTMGSLIAIRTSMLSKMPRLSEIRVDGWVLCFALGLSLVTGLIIGSVPALHLMGPGVSRAMKEGGFTTRSRSLHGWLRAALLVSEVALSLILLTGAGLMVRSFWRLVTVDIGYDARNVLTVGAKFDLSLKDRIRQLPGIEGAAFGEPPVWGGGMYEKFGIAGRDISVDGKYPEAKFIKISEDYFTVLRIPLLMGRPFVAGDHADAEHVAIVNRTIAGQYFPDRSPLDQVINVKGNNLSFRIVGVVGDVRPNGFRSDVMPAIYLPFSQADKWFSVNNSLIFRARGDLAPVLTAVRREFLAMQPLSLPPRLWTLDEQLNAPIRPMRANMQLLSIFAALALVLAAVGVYGLMAFSVSQHTQEIGVRMALGARGLDILRSVVGQGLKLSLIGTGIGLAGAFALTRVISSLLYDVSPTDPLTFAFVSLVLVSVAVLASYLPARRASKIDPMVALRYE